MFQGKNASKCHASSQTFLFSALIGVPAELGVAEGHTRIFIHIQDGETQFYGIIVNNVKEPLPSKLANWSSIYFDERYIGGFPNPSGSDKLARKIESYTHPEEIYKNK